MKKVLVITLLSLVVLSPVLACNEDEDLQPSSSKPGVSTVTGSNVQVTVTPLVVNLEYGARVTFSAGVTGTTDKSVTWSIDEGTAGGTITTGVYIAPQKTGLYHVRATSKADPSKSGWATADVKAPSATSKPVTSPSSGTTTKPPQTTEPKPTTTPSAADNLTLLQKTTWVGGSVKYQATEQETDIGGKSKYDTGDYTIFMSFQKAIPITWSGRAFSGKLEYTTSLFDKPHTIEVTGMVSTDGVTLTSFKYLDQSKKEYNYGAKTSETERLALANVPLNQESISAFYCEQNGIAVGKYVMSFERERTDYEPGYYERGKIVGAGTKSSKFLDQKASAKSYLLVKFGR